MGQRSSNRPPLLLAIAIALALGLLLLGVVARNPPLTIETGLTWRLRDWADGPLRPLFTRVSQLASLPEWDAAVVLAALTSFVMGRRRLGERWLAGLGVEPAVIAAKAIAAWPIILAPSAVSQIVRAEFPSAHVARVVVGLGIAVAAVRHPFRRWIASLAAAAAVTTAGAAQVGVWAHFPSGAVGGCLLGGAWLALVLYWLPARRCFETTAPTTPPVAPDLDWRRIKF